MLIFIRSQSEPFQTDAEYLMKCLFVRTPKGLNEIIFKGSIPELYAEKRKSTCLHQITRKEQSVLAFIYTLRVSHKRPADFPFDKRILNTFFAMLFYGLFWLQISKQKWNNPVKQRKSPHFPQKKDPNYYDFTTQGWALIRRKAGKCKVTVKTRSRLPHSRRLSNILKSHICGTVSLHI